MKPQSNQTNQTNQQNQLNDDIQIINSIIAEQKTDLKSYEFLDLCSKIENSIINCSEHNDFEQFCSQWKSENLSNKICDKFCSSDQSQGKNFLHFLLKPSKQITGGSENILRFNQFLQVFCEGLGEDKLNSLLSAKDNNQNTPSSSTNFNFIRNNSSVRASENFNHLDRQGSFSSNLIPAESAFRAPIMQDNIPTAAPGYNPQSTVNRQAWASEKSKSNYTSLIHAIRYINDRITDFDIILIRDLVSKINKNDINNKDTTGNTPLTLAATRKKTLICSILIEAGAFIDTSKQLSELETEAQNFLSQNKSLRTVLANPNASSNITSSYIAQPASIQSGAQPASIPSWAPGYNPSYIAQPAPIQNVDTQETCSSDYSKDFHKYLINQIKNPRVFDEETFRQLVDAVKVNINNKDIDGNTPLTLAALRRNEPVCRILINAGAFFDTNTKPSSLNEATARNFISQHQDLMNGVIRNNNPLTSVMRASAAPTYGSMQLNQNSQGREK